MSDATQTGSEFVFIYTPLPDMTAAEGLARALVVDRLAACVNIYPGIVSVYPWKGEIETSAEVVAFVKTRRALVGETLAAMRKLHPYEVPAFLVLPIEGGNEDYLAWARGQIRP